MKDFTLGRFLYHTIQLCKKYASDEMSVYAAQASFFIILAAFPFFMLLLALIDLIPVLQQSDLLRFLIEIMPDTLDPLVLNVLEHIREDSAPALLSISAAAATWSAARGMLSIERGLNRVFRVDVQRGYLLRRLLCSGYTVIFTILCAVTLALLVFGNTLERQLFTFHPELTPLRAVLTPARGALALFLLAAFFLTFYVVLPHQKQTIRDQIPGSLFSAVGWSGFSVAFSFYFRHMGSLTPIYGNLTTIILLMLWLYFGICILFFGAELNEYLTHFI